MEAEKITGPGVSEIRKHRSLWSEMTLFERFEHIVMLFVSFLLAVIILVAVYRLAENVYQLVVAQVMDKTDFRAFQVIFGMLLTLLIAFEFRNSIDAMLQGRGLLIQVKIVVLIAIIALSRKFLVLDTKEHEPAMVAALSGVVLSLGLVYWLLGKREKEERT